MLYYLDLSLLIPYAILVGECCCDTGEENRKRDWFLVQMVTDQDGGGFSLDLSKFSLRRCTDEMDMDEEEEVLKHLNTINSSGGLLVVSTDKLSVWYTGVYLHGHDVGVVQVNCLAPVKRLVYYFEIFVKNAGAKGQIAIGFTNEHFKMRRQPGSSAGELSGHCIPNEELISVLTGWRMCAVAVGSY